MTAAPLTGQQAPVTPDQAAWFADTFDRLVANVSAAVLGKSHVVRLTLTCLLSGGHLLLEDFPGTGKTSLARAVAATVQASHSRIQFTPDLQDRKSTRLNSSHVAISYAVLCVIIINCH